MGKNISQADWLGSEYSFEILQTSFTVKNSEKVVKSECFEKYLRWAAIIFLRNEAGIKSSFYKNIDISINY